jgi:integrase
MRSKSDCVPCLLRIGAPRTRVEIMLETGMRVGEALALDWKSVQLGAGQCALKRPSSTF